MDLVFLCVDSLTCLNNSLTSIHIPKVVGYSTLRDRWSIVRVLCITNHVFASRVIRCCSRLPNCYVPCEHRKQHHLRYTDDLAQVYVAAYLLTLTYAKTSAAGRIITTLRKFC